MVALWPCLSCGLDNLSTATICSCGKERTIGRIKTGKNIADKKNGPLEQQMLTGLKMNISGLWPCLSCGLDNLSTATICSCGKERTIGHIKTGKNIADKKNGPLEQQMLTGLKMNISGLWPCLSCGLDNLSTATICSCGKERTIGHIKTGKNIADKKNGPLEQQMLTGLKMNISGLWPCLSCGLDNLSTATICSCGKERTIGHIKTGKNIADKKNGPLEQQMLTGLKMNISGLWPCLSCGLDNLSTATICSCGKERTIGHIKTGKNIADKKNGPLEQQMPIGLKMNISGLWPCLSCGLDNLSTATICSCGKERTIGLIKTGKNIADKKNGPLEQQMPIGLKMNIYGLWPCLSCGLDNPSTATICSCGKERTKGLIKTGKNIADKKNGPLEQQMPIGLKMNISGPSSSPKDDMSAGQQTPKSKIRVIINDLAHVQADVLVNSVGTDAKLVSGSVSYALLEAGGSSLQDEINQKYPFGLKIGDIAQTNGGHLECQKVFHVVLRQWMNVMDTAESLLRRVVCKCLQLASEHGFKSIAFPALGAGTLRFPGDRSACVMFSAIESFFQTNLASSLKSVKLVLHPRDNIGRKEFIGRRDGSDVVHENYHSRSILLKTGMGKELKLQVIIGCLSKLQADVLVNTTQSDLDLSIGAVSRCILMKAGQILQTECRNQCFGGLLEPGQMVQTQGGKLNCTNVFHVVLPRWKSGKSKFETMFQTVVMNCLQEASNMHHKSIGFPVLGSGYLEYPPEKSASLFLATVIKFLNEASPTPLQTVYIVIAHKDTAIRNVVERELEENGVTTSILGTSGSGLITGESLALVGSGVEYFPLLRGSFTSGSLEEQHFNYVQSHFNSSIETDKTNRHKYKITKVEYVVNPENISKFRSSQERMSERRENYGIPVLAYHGTAAENVKSICREGFRPPNHKKFKKSTDIGWYGNGIYFSTFARFAMNYMKKSKMLLLCKVLQGKVFKCKEMKLGHAKEQGFDSHVDPFGKEIVMYDNECILPCYIVYFDICGRFKLEGDKYDEHENDDTEIQYLSEMEMHKGEKIPGKTQQSSDDEVSSDDEDPSGTVQW